MILGNASEICASDEHDHMHSKVVQELISGNMLTCQFLTWLGSMGNVGLDTIFIVFLHAHVTCVAGLAQHHFFGRPQPSLHCLIGNGGVADRKDRGAACNKDKSEPSSARCGDKYANAWGNSER